MRKHSKKHLTLDQYLNKVDAIKESSDALDKVDDSIKNMKKNMMDYQNLSDDRIDLISNIYALQKLCLFFEDLSQGNEGSKNCSLMAAAENDLTIPANEYNHFVRYLSKHKNRLFSYPGAENYVQRLQEKIAYLNEKVINSEEARSRDVNFME